MLTQKHSVNQPTNTYLLSELPEREMMLSAMMKCYSISWGLMVMVTQP